MAISTKKLQLTDFMLFNDTCPLIYQNCNFPSLQYYQLYSIVIIIIIINFINIVCRSIPEDINRIQTLQILDLRLNQITTTLPSTLPELLIFFSLNIRGNEVTELDMRRAKNLHVVNCSDNLIRTLSLHKGRVSMINARNNCK